MSALTFYFVYPIFSHRPDPFSESVESTIAWRVMFWTGVIPALLVLWIRSGVSESPVWLERQQHLNARADRGSGDRVSLVRLFRPDLVGATIQSSLLMSVFMFSYYSITFWIRLFCSRSVASHSGT